MRVRYIISREPLGLALWRCSCITSIGINIASFLIPPFAENECIACLRTLLLWPINWQGRIPLRFLHRRLQHGRGHDG